MKALKLIFGLFIILVLISGSAVVAQVIDPPIQGEGWQYDPYELEDRPGAESSPPVQDIMIDKTLAETSIVFRDQAGNISYIPTDTSPEPLAVPAAGAEPLIPESLVPEIIVPPAEKPADLPTEESTDSTRVLDPVTALIPIATANAPVWEYNPQVAHGGNYYMVAYVKDGDIYAAVLNNNGVLVNSFLVDSWVNDFNLPKIAYHAPTGLFLVAYQYFNSTTDYDIWMATISPSGVVDGFWGFSASDDDRYPDIACSQTASTCLLAFERNANAIKGRYVTLNSSGISSTSAIYNLSDFGGTRPFLAWGRGSGRYFLAYTWTNGSGVDFPIINHIYQTDPGVDPYTHSALLAMDYSTWPAYDKWATGVAYDPCTEKFVMIWDYDWLGSGADIDVLLAVFHNQAGIIYQHGWIAGSTAAEKSGDINFISDDNLAPGCYALDKLGITYTDWTSKRVYATDLRGNSKLSGTNYTWDGKSKHLIIYEYPAGTEAFWKPSITSGPSRSEMLVAINYHNISTANYNVYGKLVRAPGRVFLPLLVK